MIRVEFINKEGGREYRNYYDYFERVRAIAKNYAKRRGWLVACITKDE